MQKILSIVIPTYNAERFLDKGLTSYIMEEPGMMDKLEVIVVNDGTPDDSVAVAQKYVEMYPDTYRIINKKNGGHGSAINVGAKQVRGKYFKVVDADDWVDTEYLIRTIKELERLDCDAVVQSFRTYDISHQPAEIEAYDIRYPKIEGKAEHIYSMRELMDHWWDVQAAMCFHGLIYRSSFYNSQNYELLEGVFYEDLEYATIPLSRAKRIALMEEELYVYRIGDVNQSVALENMYKRLPHLEAVAFRLVDFEEEAKKCPEGGYDYWLRKLSKNVADIYRKTLIECSDKKKYRPFCKEFTEKIRNRSEDIYQAVKNKYKVFRILNRAHINADTYESKVMPFVMKLRKYLKTEM